MFESAYGSERIVTAVVIAVLELTALIVVWAGRERPTLIKVIWSAIVLLLPLVGAVGFFINQALGRISRHLRRRSDAT
ncbi:hypothetical protein [Frondihabitans australicus]|uniref:Phospholipase D-like protein n=1 Tax=Frondihabitans australicus TaxID=386892 RepID=A0A495IAH9_9MICO|nr:hypothetical protein [Frondihabitans australicus]RKR73023.1 hypothetical protein C8E83_0105 [Frondihabitans australicus]